MNSDDAIIACGGNAVLHVHTNQKDVGTRTTELST